MKPSLPGNFCHGRFLNVFHGYQCLDVFYLKPISVTNLHSLENHSGHLAFKFVKYKVIHIFFLQFYVVLSLSLVMFSFRNPSMYVCVLSFS